MAAADQTISISWTFKYHLSSSVNASRTNFQGALVRTTKSGFADYLVRGDLAAFLRAFTATFVTTSTDRTVLRRSIEVNTQVRMEDVDIGDTGRDGVVPLSRTELRSVWMDLHTLREDSTAFDAAKIVSSDNLQLLKRFMEGRWIEELASIAVEASWTSSTLLGNYRDMRLSNLQLSCGSAVTGICDQMQLDALGIDSYAGVTTPKDSGFQGLPFIILGAAMFLAPICFGRKGVRVMKRVCDWMSTPSKRQIRQAAARDAQRRQAAMAKNPRPVTGTQVSQAIVAKCMVKKDVPAEISGSKDDTCVVCLSEFVEGIDCSLLPCGHVLHWRCWALWSARSQQCPMCRVAPKWEDISKVLFTVKDADPESTVQEAGTTMENLALELEAVRMQLGVNSTSASTGDRAYRSSASSDEAGRPQSVPADARTMKRQSSKGSKGEHSGGLQRALTAPLGSSRRLGEQHEDSSPRPARPSERRAAQGGGGGSRGSRKKAGRSASSSELGAQATPTVVGTSSETAAEAITRPKRRRRSKGPSQKPIASQRDEELAGLEQSTTPAELGDVQASTNAAATMVGASTNTSSGSIPRPELGTGGGSARGRSRRSRSREEAPRRDVERGLDHFEI
mmetsp:Transcript_44869/g.81856  ORF Transcript_44869/g.81856 Transcript_44869/m.81856 type:complete len:621 (+) Transcript_44869:83-1945(+)